MQIKVTKCPEDYIAERAQQEKEQTCPICNDKRPKIGFTSVGYKGIFRATRTETTSYHCGACGSKWDVIKEDRF